MCSGSLPLASRALATLWQCLQRESRGANRWTSPDAGLACASRLIGVAFLVGRRALARAPRPPLHEHGPLPDRPSGSRPRPVTPLHASTALAKGSPATTRLPGDVH